MVKDISQMQSTDGEPFWSPGQSLWSLISEHVSESELPKIHAALGHSLVDRYTEAHAEAEMWQKRWRDTQLGALSRTGTPLPGQHRPPLADPPAVKELVRAEVRMLLQTLSERAGRNGEELLSLYKPETVNYALGHLDRCYSNPEVNDSRSVSRLSVQSSAEDEIEAVRENLNIDGIEQVVDRLKSLFMEECAALKKEIKQLQRNIWTKSRQDLDEPEPTLGDLRELRDAIQKDLALFPGFYKSTVKDIKNTHRLASVTSHQLRVSSASSLPREKTQSSHTQPKPPTCPPPSRTFTSPRPIDISSPSETSHSTSAITEPRKTTPPKPKLLHSASPSRPCSAQINRPDSNPSPEHHRHHCTTPTNASSFPIKSPKNSPSHKTHLSSHGSIHNTGAESNLSPHMERKRSPEQRSRNTNIVHTAISPRSYECNKDCKRDDCSRGRAKTLNGSQHMTCGNNLWSTTTPLHYSTRKSTEMPPNICEIGLANPNPEVNTNESGHHQEAPQLYTQPKGHLSSSSPRRVVKVNVSQPHSEKQERTETEFLNRFIQPVPPPRVK